MSIENVTTEVQPDAAAATEAAPAVESQGSNGSGLFPDLSSFPEDIRPQIESTFREWDSNVQSEFTKRAEQLKTWEPYSELGLTDYSPDDVEKLLAFGQLASDDEQFKGWVEQVAQSLGLIEGAPAEEPGAAGGADPTAAAVEAVAGGQELTPESVQKMIADAITQDRSTRDQESQMQATLETQAQAIRGRLDELVAGQGFGADDQAARDEFEDNVLAFAAMAETDDPVESINQGFARVQRLIGGAEKSVLQTALEQPKSPEKGGGAPARMEAPSSFDDAASRTRELLSQTASL